MGVLEEISFSADKFKGQTVTITAQAGVPFSLATILTTLVYILVCDFRQEYALERSLANARESANCEEYVVPLSVFFVRIPDTFRADSEYARNLRETVRTHHFEAKAAFRRVCERME